MNRIVWSEGKNTLTRLISIEAAEDRTNKYEGKTMASLQSETHREQLLGKKALSSLTC